MGNYSNTCLKYIFKHCAVDNNTRITIVEYQYYLFTKCLGARRVVVNATERETGKEEKKNGVDTIIATHNIII